MPSALSKAILVAALAICAPAADLAEFGVEAARSHVAKTAAEAKKLGAQQPDVLFLAARAQSALGQHTEAGGLAIEALRLDPKRGDIEHFLGKLLLRQNRLKEAAVHMRRAIALGHTEGTWRLLGMAMEHSGDRAEAKRCYEKAVNFEPNDAEARFLLGNLLLQEDNFESAIAELQRACELDAKSAGARYALAQAQLRLNQSDAAQNSLKIFRELKRAENDQAAKKEIGASDQAPRFIAANFQTELAKLFTKEGSTAAAIAHLRDAVHLAPDDAAAREMLVGLHLQKNDAAAARGHLEKLVQLDPDNATHHLNLGTVLLRLRDRAGAVRELKHAVALDPKQPEALNNLARAYLGAGENKTEALDHARALVALQPTAANHDLLAWALYANGQIEPARAASKKSTELDPANQVFQRRYQQLLAK